MADQRARRRWSGRGPQRGSKHRATPGTRARRPPPGSTPGSARRWAMGAAAPRNRPHQCGLLQTAEQAPGAVHRWRGRARRGRRCQHDQGLEQYVATTDRLHSGLRRLPVRPPRQRWPPEIRDGPPPAPRARRGRQNTGPEDPPRRFDARRDVPARTPQADKSRGRADAAPALPASWSG